MSHPRIAFLANLARRLSERPETTGLTRVEWGEVAAALESHQRLAETLKQLLDNPAPYSAAIDFESVGHEVKAHSRAIAEARAALREAGVTDDA